MAESGDEMAGDELGHVHLRASHADREQVVDVLKIAFVHGLADQGRVRCAARPGARLADRRRTDVAHLRSPGQPGFSPAAAPVRSAEAADRSHGHGDHPADGRLVGGRAGGPSPDGGAVAMLLFAFTFAWTGILLLTGSVLLESRKHERSGGQLMPPPGPDGGGQSSRPPAPAAQFPPIDRGQPAAEATRSDLSHRPAMVTDGVMGRSHYLVAGVPAGFHRRGEGSAAGGPARLGTGCGSWRGGWTTRSNLAAQACCSGRSSRPRPTDTTPPTTSG